MPAPVLARRSLLAFITAGLLAVLLLLAPAPGSLSVVGTRWLASLGSGVANVELVSELGLLLIAIATAAAGGQAWFRLPQRRAPLVAAATGVVVAYLASEGAKIALAQPRPCTRWPIARECPPAGDWSLPSNHATLAFGAAVVIGLAIGVAWVTWASVAAAALVAVGRVAQGVHYVHDIALGAILGLAIPAALAALVIVCQNRAGRGVASRGSRSSRNGEADAGSTA